MRGGIFRLRRMGNVELERLRALKHSPPLQDRPMQNRRPAAQGEWLVATCSAAILFADPAVDRN
jgi:hypothetical protein